MPEEFKQFVFRTLHIWHNTCSCGEKEQSFTQTEANQKRDAHALTHSVEAEHDKDVMLSEARTEFFEAHNSLNHVGSGMADRLRRFHSAWEALNAIKRKFGFATTTPTKPRVK